MLSCATLHPSEKRLAVGDTKGTLKIFDIIGHEAGNMVISVEVGSSSISSLGYNPNGDALAVVQVNG